MAKTIGSLAVNIVANTQGLQSGLKRAEKAVTGFQGRVQGVTRSLVSFRNLLTVGVVGGLTAFVKRQLDAVDALGKTSDQLGIATEQLAGLQHAASLADVSSEQLTVGLTRMLNSISESAMGIGEARQSIEQLNLSAQRLKSLAPDQAFAEIADALNRVPNPADRARIALDIFGRSGLKLLSLTKEGSAGLAALAKDAEELGLTVDRNLAAKVEAANDAVTRMQSAFAGLGRTMAVELAPAIKNVVDLLTQLVALTGKGVRGGVSLFDQSRAGFNDILAGAARFAAGIGERLGDDPNSGAVKDLRNFADALGRSNQEIFQKTLPQLNRDTGGRPQLGTGDRLATFLGFELPKRIKEAIDAPRRGPGAGEQFERFARDLFGARTPGGAVAHLQQRQFNTLRDSLFGQFAAFGRFAGGLRSQPQQFGQPASNAALEEGTREAFIAQRAGRSQKHLQDINRNTKDQVSLLGLINRGIGELKSVGASALNVVSIPGG